MQPQPVEIPVVEASKDLSAFNPMNPVSFGLTGRFSPSSLFDEGLFICRAYRLHKVTPVVALADEYERSELPHAEH